MSNSPKVKSASNLTAEVQEMKIEESYERTSARDASTPAVSDLHQPSLNGVGQPTSQHKGERTSESPSSKTNASHSLTVKPEHEETIGGEVSLKMEAGKPKLSRKMSQKVVARPPPLFSHLPHATDDATATFEVMPDCHYMNKGLGSTEPALDCDCTEEWGTSWWAHKPSQLFWFI